MLFEYLHIPFEEYLPRSQRRYCDGYSQILLFAERAERSEVAEPICHLMRKMYMKFHLLESQNVPFASRFPKLFIRRIKHSSKAGRDPPKKISDQPRSQGFLPLYNKDLFISLPPTRT